MAKKTSKEKTETKQEPQVGNDAVRMFNGKIYADVHPAEVENYRKNGYTEA